MFSVEYVMNVLEEEVHNLWKFHSEQLNLEVDMRRIFTVTAVK